MSERSRQLLRLIGFLAVPLGVASIVFAIVIQPPSDKLQQISDATSITLPDGGEVTIYGKDGIDRASDAIDDYGCALLNDEGEDVATGLNLSTVKAVSSATATLDGQTLQPLIVIDYDREASLQCSGLSAYAPLARSEASTFGDSTTGLRLFAGFAGVCFIGFGLFCLLLARSPRD